MTPAMVRALAPCCLLLAACSGASRRASSEGEPAAAAATSAPRHQPSGEPATILLRVAGAKSIPEGLRVRQRSSSGEALLVSGRVTAAPESWQVIAGVDSGLLEQKVQNPVLLLDQVVRAGAGGLPVSCLLELHLPGAPRGEPAIRQALAGADFQAGTLAGDVATGKLKLSGLGRLLTLRWVNHLELSAGVKLR